MWTANDVTFHRNYVLACASASYVWNANDANLIYTSISAGIPIGGGAGHGGAGVSGYGPQARKARTGRYFDYANIIDDPELFVPAPEPQEPEPQVEEPAPLADLAKPAEIEEVEAEPPPEPTIEERVERAIEKALAKANQTSQVERTVEKVIKAALAESKKIAEPTAQELQDAEDKEEMRLLKQLGFLGSD